MKSFDFFYERALQCKGSEARVKDLLPVNILTPDQLRKVSDDRFLSEITKAVFQAGFYWKVVEAKWSDFEKAFWQFDVIKCASMFPDELEALAKDDRIIRNPQKIKTVPRNAAMILACKEADRSFAQRIADWPDDDFIGLLSFLHKKGARLGPKTCQYFLRSIGKDGFVLGRDGVRSLVLAGIIEGEPTSKTDLKKIQQAYNFWRDESGFSNAQISKILAMS